MRWRLHQHTSATMRLVSTFAALLALVLAGCVPLDETSETVSSDSAALETAPPVLPTSGPTPTFSPEIVAPTPPAGLLTAPEPVPQTGSLSADFDTQAAADACWAGLMAECDRLFSLSQAGSELEVFAAGCGARTQPLGTRCADTFLSTNISLSTLLAEGINVRTSPDLDARVIGTLRESSGGQVTLTGSQVNGWHPIVYHFQHGWVFGAFVFPEQADEAVVRTKSLEPIELENARGEAVSGGTGSFGLVTERIDDLTWRVLLPTGDLATVDPSGLDIIAERTES